MVLSSSVVTDVLIGSAGGPSRFERCVGYKLRSEVLLQQMAGRLAANPS
jgi:hypothetical protein